MTIADAINVYFETHSGGDRWTALDADMQTRALTTATDDVMIELFGVDLQADNALLIGAIAEQALFVAEVGANREAEHGKLISQSVDGIGSVSYTPAGGSVVLCERAKRFIARILNSGGLRVVH